MKTEREYENSYLQCEGREGSSSLFRNGNRSRFEGLYGSASVPR